MKTYGSHFLGMLRPAALLAGLVFAATASVNAQLGGPSFPEPLLPPPTGSYRFAVPIDYPPGVQVSNLSILLPTASQPPPPPGGSQIYNFQAAARCVLASGGTFLDEATGATIVMSVTADAAGSDTFHTEMLSLSLSGGSLPAGVMIRESPTLASTGKTRISPQSSGAFRIDSFFDVFTELSLDGGQTWTPANGGARCLLNAPSSESTFASPNLLPATATYVGASSLVTLNDIVIRNFTLSEPTQSQPPPSLGGSQVIPTSLTARGELSLNGGQTFAPFMAPATAAPRVTSLVDSGATRFFDTEMSQLDIAGGSLPGGVRIRESPTLPSLGRTSIRSMPDGTSNQISSFFDVFTELSIDGGQNWSKTKGTCVCSIASPQSTTTDSFFATDCFPLAGTYQTSGDAAVSFGNGIVIRNFSHRPDAPRLAPPAPGQQQTRALGGIVELNLSRDNGQSFQPCLAITLSDCLVSGYNVAGGGSGGDRPMESISLNFAVITPGLPPVMIRESPTRASQGKTSVRQVEGGYLINSFFDIFTEVSIDGGQTWTPADAPLHASLLPYVEQDNVFSSNFLPPRDGSFEMRRYAEPIAFANGMRIRKLNLAAPSRSQPAPAPGTMAADLDCDGRLDFEVSTDAGFTWTQVDGPTVFRVATGDVNGDGVIESSMAAMNMQFPAGGMQMMIRESPSRPSQGLTHIRMGSDPIHPCHIDSFFDVFTELSLDGGQTWSAAENGAHLELHAKPEEVFAPSDWLPLAVQYRETDFNFVASFSEFMNVGGVIIVLDGVAGIPDGRAPPPGPGQSLTRMIATSASMNLTLDGGHNYIPVTAQAYLSIKLEEVMVSSFHVANSEILHLSIAGETLPPGVMIRESPTRASTGRTEIRAINGGYRISSFFDVFTELTVDGGQTWIPASEPLRVAAAQGAPKKSFGSAMIRAEAPLASLPGGMSLSCATGTHIKDGKITRSSTGGVPPPGPGQSLIVQDNATIEFLYSNDDGQTFTPVRAPAFFRYEMENTIVSHYQTRYDTEMLQLDVAGGSLPAGVRIRESPSRPSLGSRLMEEEGIFYFISSFFDVFMEISFDNGATWEPFDAAMRFVLHEVVISSIQAKNEWPPPGHFRSPPPGDPDFDLLFLGGTSLSFFDIFVADDFAATTPLPGPGQSSIFDWQAQAKVTLRSGGSDVTSNETVLLRARITQQGDVTGDGVRTYDTEMLYLNLQGPSLPAGVMIRESPTKASVGRLISQARADGQFSTSSFFDVFVEVSEDGGVTWSPSDGPVSLRLSGPEITVEQPAGTDLVDAAATVPFGALLNGTTVAREFTIKNTATGGLTGLGITIDGTNPLDFSVTTNPTAPVAPSTSTTFTVRFAPTVAGMKSADLHLTSNDSDESPFDIHLVGRGVLPGGDDDGDGITNGAEFGLAAYGFDFLQDSSQDIASFRNNGFYRASDVQALNMDVPLLAKDPVSGEFTLTFGIRKSADLLNFSPFPMSAPQTLINGDGKLEFRFMVPDNASFFRVQAP